MFNTKKKPGLAIMIAGKDPEAPEPIEKSAFGKKPQAMPGGKPGGSPFGKATGMGDEESDAHEAAETPAYESSEEAGTALIQDIEAAGGKHGMDGAQSRAFAADLFSAVSECLKRDSGGGAGAGDTGERAGSYDTGSYPA